MHVNLCYRYKKEKGGPLMSSYLDTITHDLQGIKKIIIEMPRKSTNYGVISFTLLRDVCIMLYEINLVLKSEGIIQTEPSEMETIKKLRHKMKTDQGMNNRKIFNNLLDNFRKNFGNDIDNIGFYLNDDILAISTIYQTFIFENTPYLNTTSPLPIYHFSKSIGSLTESLLNSINKDSKLKSGPLLNIQEKAFTSKDIWNQRFFIDDITHNIFLTRLILIQSELTGCIWLEKFLDYNNNELTLDKYILIRLTSIKFYEIMRNLNSMISIKKFEQHWDNFNLKELRLFVVAYNSTIKNEIKTLRNMVHYNNNGTNFYEFILNKELENDKYVDELINNLFNKYIFKMRILISKGIDINSYESMSDAEKKQRRIRTIVSGKDPFSTNRS